MIELRDDTCILFLIRHGATENNLANPPILQGSSVDMPLSAAGREQAARVAELLASQQLGAVFSSTLKRARETAEVVAARHGLPVASFDELREVDVGNWENRSWEEIARTEPEAYRAFMRDASEHGYAGGENLNQLRQRVAPVIERLMHENRGRRIALVGHNVVNRVILAPLMYRPMSKASSISQENCCVNVIRLRGAEQKLLTVNAAFHLEGAYI